MLPQSVVLAGIAVANDIGGVHEIEVPTPVPIVPDKEPKLYLTVWVKDPEALLILIVRAVPRVPVISDDDDARGIVGKP